MTGRSPNLQKYFESGAKAMAAQDYEGAATWFAALLDLDPTDSETLELCQKAQMLHAQKGLNFIKRLWYLLWGNILFGLGLRKAACQPIGVLSLDNPHKGGFAAKYGKCLMATQQPALAALAFQRALKFMPKNKSILKSAGPAFEAIDDKPTAIEIYHTLSRLEPKNGAWSLKVKDVSALHYGNEGGITDLTSARAVEEKKAADSQTIEGKEQRIKDLLAEYKEEPEENGHLLPQIGRLLVDIKKYDQALPIWQRVLEASAKAEPAPADEDQEEGEEKKEEERTDQVPLEEAQYQIAFCNEKKGNFDESEEGYRHLFEAHPTDPRYCEALYTMRLERIAKQIEDDPENAAQVQERQGLEKEFLDKKIEIYRDLTDKRGGDPDLLLRYGKLLAEGGDLDKAIPIVQKASQNPARAYPALRQLGWLFIEKGQMPLAIDTFKRALEKAPASRSATAEMKDIWYGLGESYFRQGDKDNAREWWKNIYECDVEFRDIRERYEEIVAV